MCAAQLGDELDKALILRQYRAARELIAAGAPINRQYNQQYSVISLQIKRRNLPALELLLKCAADPNFADCSGCTPLHLAAWLGYIDCVERLITYGADINAQDSNGATALHWAARGNHSETVMYLLRNECDAEIRDSRGETALHDAAHYRGVDAARCLLVMGASPTIINLWRETPVCIAQKKNFTEFVKLCTQS